MPYKDPVKNREASKLAMRRVRAQLRATREVVGLLSDRSLGPIREDSLSDATSVLASLMVKEGLTPQKIIAKISQRMDSQTVKTIAKEREVLEDNDAQLKATELAIDLSARAGLLPSDRSHNSSGNINLQIISFGAVDSEPNMMQIEAPAIEVEES